MALTSWIKRKEKIFLSVLLISAVCNNAITQNKEQTLHNLNTLLVNTVMDDLFTPPVASRIYVYPNIAFYECIRHDDPTLPSMSGKLNGLNNIPPLPREAIDNFIAASIAFSYVGQSLVGTEYKIEDWRKAFTDSLLTHADQGLVKNSIQYGHTVADSIISWSRKDNYLRSRGLSRFVLSKVQGTWQPTPEDYAQAIEPNWNTIRPLTLQSASQFSPKEKLRYSSSKKSVYYKTMMEVYHIVKNLDTLRKATALYWDDNPNVAVVEGHLTYYVHKVSPGGHWLMIAKEGCIKRHERVTRSSYVYALTSIAVFDAIIACWDEKFKTNLVRPITIINQFIDQDWKPYIQTPPFPEFTSGHAVISNAAATVLTALLGDNFEFTDETEIPFGNKPRRLNSFNDAAFEATMSRVYGGIHYPETARISILQGKAVGNHVLKTLFVPSKIKQ
jgi:hypothetical protein